MLPLCFLVQNSFMQGGPQDPQPNVRARQPAIRAAVQAAQAEEGDAPGRPRQQGGGRGRRQRDCQGQGRLEENGE